RDELGQPFTFFPRRSEAWIWIPKPSESHVKEFVCRRRTSTCPLPVERPTKDQLCRAILFSRHSSEPMIDQRGLSDPGPGNDGYDIYLLVCPGIIQESDVSLSPKNI